MTAKMIPVLPITDALLKSSTVNEPDTGDGAAWDVGTGYSQGAKVSKNHVNYESVQGSNTGNDPETDDGTWWTELTATNRWAVFDGYIQNQATQADSAEWVITPSEVITGVSLFNVSAASVTIAMTDPVDGVVYDEDYSLLDNSGVFDLWTYFFSPIITSDTLCVTDLPPYAGADLSITVERDGGTVAVGQIAIGYVETLGITANEVPLGNNDFSRLNEDEFGRTSPVQRGYARTATPLIYVDTSRVPFIERKLADQRATPTVWAFDTRYGDNQLAYLGFYKSYSFVFQFAAKSALDLDIRSLV